MAKFSVLREGFLAAMQAANVGTAKKDLKPILRNIKVDAGEVCTLQATDLELGIRLLVDGIKVESPGACLLPADKLISILREATDEELLVEGDADRVFVQGAFSEFELPGGNPEEFPDVSAGDGGDWREVDGAVLRTLIRRTMFAAASAEHARFGATTGVLIQFADNKARLVGTDGRCLALAESSLPGEPLKGQVVVPTRVLGQLEKHLAEGSPVRVGLRANEAVFVAGGLTLVTRLVEGRFPDYQRVLPKDVQATVLLTVGPFHAVIRQAALMTDETSKRVVFAFSKGKLTLTTRGSQVGRSKVELPLEYDGKPMEIGFDPKYLINVLKVLDPAESLTLHMQTGALPAMLANEAGDYRYVVTPLVTKEG